MAADGTVETGLKPACPRVILSNIEFDELKELLEFNLRYCDGDKSGWPPVLCSGKMALPKALKLLGTPAIFGTYTLHEATKEYLASTWSCPPEARHILRQVLVNGPHAIEERGQSKPADKLTGIDYGEVMDLIKKENILPDDLDIDKMSAGQLADHMECLKHLNIGDKQREMSNEELNASIDDWKKTQAAEKIEEKKKRSQGRKRSNATKEAHVDRKAEGSTDVDDEEGGKGRASDTDGAHMPDLPDL